MMTTLTVEIPPEAYNQLREKADRLGKPPQVVAQELLIERLAKPTSERERIQRLLAEAGLLAEVNGDIAPTPVNVTAEDVGRALAQAGGKSLSDIVSEQRGPKD